MEEFRKVKPMDCGETFAKPYSAQNILEDQLDFPQFFYEEDTVHTMYSDRMLDWDWDKYNALRQKHFGNKGQNWNCSLDPKKIKAFLEDYMGESIDGFRNTRFTHLGNGFPVWFFETYKRSDPSPKQKVYSGQSGPLVSMDAGDS